MQLKVRRNQKRGMTGKVIFTLDVMAELTPEERALVDRYKLGAEVCYSSEAANDNAARMYASVNLKAMGAVIVDRLLKRFFTIKDLVSGQHIECKDLAEVLAAEEQVRVACVNLKRYLEVVQTFDGREEIVEVSAAA